MDWDTIITVIIAFTAAIGLPVALARRKKGGPKQLDEFLDHLHGIGVKASQLEESEQEKLGKKRSWGERSEGLIQIADRTVDFINVVSVSSQYGVKYYVEYLARSSSQTLREGVRKTKMTKKKRPPLWGKVVDIEWKGDPHLSQRLNFDYQLKYGLLQGGSNTLKGGISILPETKHGFTKIRTDYQLPSPELFQAIDTIAKHVKSWA